LRAEQQHDPVLALFAEQLEPKRPDCTPLAGKGTLNRLEHAPSGARSDHNGQYSHRRC